MQFLCNFGKHWWLRISKTFNKEQIGCREGFFRNYLKFCKGKKFATKSYNKIKMYQFFTFSCNFCQISKDFTDHNVEYLQPRMISLSNGVVCGDKCSFVKKKNCHMDPKIVNESYFFTFLYFITQFCERFNLFMKKNSETIQQLLKALSGGLSDGISASFW